jgi:hypothetical protein
MWIGEWEDMHGKDETKLSHVRFTSNKNKAPS